MANPDVIARTFVELADTLTDDYDIIDFLHVLTNRCVEALGVTDAGVVLADTRGELHALASSSERMRLVELLEVQRQDGPCLDVWRDGTPVRGDDLAAEDDARRWPIFAPAALDAGFLSVYAVPLRLRDERIGALNLFGDRPSALSAADQAIAQALADVACIGILHERFLRQRQARVEQLQTALGSRVVLEQAKGVVAEQHGIDVDEAFVVLRRHARNGNLRLTEVAHDVVDRRLTIATATRPEASAPGP